MNEKRPIEVVTQNKKVSELNKEAHACLFCGTKFVNKNDLELHSHLHKNKSFICSLCKEVFPELKLLKLHDLRHSLEEAHEEISGIENMLTTLASSPCRVCGEVFSCDEELVEHYVTSHKAVENMNNGIGGISTNDSDSCDSSGEEQINYPLLREEVVTKNGVMHVRFTLIDQSNVQVGEFVRMVEHKISSKKRYHKPDLKPKKYQKILDYKIDPRKSHAKSGSSTKLSHKVLKNKIKDKKMIQKFGSAPTKSYRAKAPKSNSLSANTNSDKKKKLKSVETVISSDSDVEIVFDNFEKQVNTKHPRHSKTLALKKKIWKSIPEGPAPSKVCYTCKKSFKSVDEYEQHLLSHKKFHCRKCYQVFRSPSLLHRHTLLHHAQSKHNSYQCETCKQEFSSVIEWKTHLKSHVTNTDLIPCSKCGLKFKTVETLNKHKCKFTNLICKMCNYKFPRPYNLRRHLTNVHKLRATEIEKLLEAATEENEPPTFPENDQEIEELKQDDEKLPNPEVEKEVC